MSLLPLIYKPRAARVFAPPTPGLVNGRKPRLRASISGGRTSARMAELLQTHMSDVYEIVYTFANTSLEHEDTLRFVHDVDREFGLNLVWLEAEVFHEEKRSCGHRVVNFNTAKRNGEVFEEVVKKYGIPNQTFKLCTRELKTNPMKSYANSIGWTSGTYETAIGIRADEGRRVRVEAAVADRIVYPLVDWWPTDKQDVLDHFERFDWDLRIPEHLGNCITCYKKSDRKLHRVYLESPSHFDFPIRLESLYSNVGPNVTPGPRKMYRGYRSASDLILSFNDADARPMSQMDGGCSESCELYEMEDA